MEYVIATRYFALKTVPLATEDQLHSFSVFCREKENEFNGDPCDYGIEYSEHSYNNDGKRLKIEFRPNWDKTDHDRLYEDATSPFPCRIGLKLEYTLVVIVPDTVHVPRYVVDKMDKYKEMVSQKPAEGTVASEDLKLIESFRIRAESIRDATPNARQSTSTNSTTPEFVTSATGATDHPRMPRALTGVDVPDSVETYEASIGDSDGSPANVNVKNPKEIHAPVVNAIEKNTKAVEKQNEILENMAESTGRSTAKWLLKADMANDHQDLKEKVLSEMGFTPVEVRSTAILDGQLNAVPVIDVFPSKFSSYGRRFC